MITSGLTVAAQVLSPRGLVIQARLTAVANRWQLVLSAPGHHVSPEPGGRIAEGGEGGGGVGGSAAEQINEQYKMTTGHHMQASEDGEASRSWLVSTFTHSVCS